MSKYHCWDNDNQVADDAVVIDAMGIEHAAELFAEQAYKEEGFDTRKCNTWMIDDAGKVTAGTIDGFIGRHRHGLGSAAE